MPDRFSRLIAWVRSRLRSARDSDADLSEEIRLHLEQRTREFVDQGLPAAQARAAAYRQFGPIEPIRDACRNERRRHTWMGTVWQDLRYGVRSLARDRAFTITALLTLTLGLGLVTSFFTVFNGILLKSWPLPDPHMVVTSTRGVPAATYRHLRDQTTSIDLVAMTSCLGFIDDDLKGSAFRCVSGNYFDVLRVPLVQGRGLRPDEDIIGAPARVAVIGDSLWRDRFARSPDAIGRTIPLNQVPFQIVGVTAPGATDKPTKNLPALWIPMAAYPLVMRDTAFNREFLSNPEYCCVSLAGRLAQAGSTDRVSAELTTVYRQFHGGADGSRGITLTGTRQIEQPWEESGVAIIGLILGAIVLVLTVACANTANLQWARAARRQQELLVRLSLGAGRGRIVRQLLTEGLPLAAAAVAGSVAFASLFAAVLARWLGDGHADDLGVDLSADWRVTLLAASIASIAVLATAIGPALRSTRRLIVQGRSVSRPVRTRAWLLVIQVSLSAILIVGASLLSRNLLHVASLDPGFDAAGVVSMTVQVPGNQSRESRVAALQSAVRAALPPQLPPLVGEAGPSRLGPVTIADGASLSFIAIGRSVSASYLPLLSVPLRAGRLLLDEDTTEVVVNEAFAARAWPGRSALGAVFVPNRSQGGGVTTGSAAAASAETPRVVVGVVGDMQQGSRPGESVRPAYFERGGGYQFLMRNDPATLDRARAVIQLVDPAARVHFEPLSASFEVGLLDMRVGVGLAWALGLVALAMAGTGVFGLCAVVAEERRREVGIRVALGAGTSAVVRLILAHAGRPLVAGLVLGFVGALLAGPLLRSYLAGISPHDPMAFLVAALVLAAAGAVATLIPMRRALRVDPAITLRAE